MSDLARLAASVVLGAFDGTTLPDWARRRLADGMGGICLFGRNVRDLEALRALTAAIHAVSPDAITCTDEEGGDVTRLYYRLGSPHAGHAVLGAVDDPELTARVAADIGSALRATGVDLALGPVADVNSNPLNPVIGVRSFGAEADLVARHTAAWVRGIQGTGVGACLKHFPGHGDTVSDSHVSLPVAEAPLALLRRRELVPFGAGIRAGAVAVMTSHVVVRALDPAQPATFSRAATTLLRAPASEGGLGFDGLLVSDALEMKGASAAIGIPAAAVRALRAGVDLLCLGADLDDHQVREALDEMVTAVEDGTLPEERLVEAAGRVTEARRRLAGLRASGGLPTASTRKGDVATASEDAARRGVAVVGTLPQLAHPQVLRLVTDANQAVGDAPWGLPKDGAILAGRPATDVREGDPLPPLDPQHALVVLVRDGHRHGWVRGLLGSLAASRPDLVVVELGWPGPDLLPGAAVVQTHGASAVSARAVDRLLAAHGR